MRAFEIHPPKQAAPPKPVPKSPRRWRRRLLAGLFLLSLGAGWWAVRPDPNLSRARQLQEELFVNREPGPPTEDRKAKFQEFRDTMGKLTDAQKRELFEPMRQKGQQEFDRYFTLSKQEKAEYLDRIIDRSEKMRKDMEQKKKAGGQPGGRGPGGFGPPGGGGKTKGPPDPDKVEERKKKMLDRSTPEDRAKRDQFRHDMDARRKQRGLPPGGGGRGPGR